MSLFEESTKFLTEAILKKNGEGTLEGREIAQIAMRVADQALEDFSDKKMSPAEIFGLLTLAYDEFKKESND